MWTHCPKLDPISDNIIVDYMKANSVLTVDLSSHDVGWSKMNDTASNFLGGRGLGARLYSQDPRNADDPKNCVFICPGFLTGTSFPSISRSNIVSSSPHTGLLLSSSFGGHFGAYLKSQGIVAIQLTGVAEDWSYVVIDGKNTRIESADDLVGMSTYEVREALRKRFTGRSVSIASIGVAGENLVKYAIAQFDSRAAGRSGSGWHFGFKKLKAIVVMKNDSPYVESHKAEMKRILSHLRERKAKHELDNNIDKYCSAPYVEYANEVQAFPASNYRRNFVSEEEMKGYDMKKYEAMTVRSEACWSCPLACTRILNSTYSDQEVKGPEYETLWSFGVNCDNVDLDVITECNRICDEYGLDTISTGNVLGWYKECVDENVVEDVWSPDRMFALIRMIGEREGIGADLAEGVVKASIHLGYGKDKVAHSKGLELPAWDPRTALGMALCYATGPTGGDHCKGWTVLDDVDDGKDRLTVKNKVERAIERQNYSAVIDSVGVCIFADFMYDFDLLAECVSVFSESDISRVELERMGDDIFQVERNINRKLGLTNDADVLPERIIGYDVEVNGQTFKLTQSMFDEMKEKYYEKRGWSKG